jgi:hypothetical protein
MHPVTTSYYLATTPQENRRCREFLAANGEHPGLNYPTVYAERGGQMVGVLSSHHRQQCLAAGPLLVITKHPAIVGMRLLEAYESVLAHAGITSYLFTIEKSLPHWRRAVESFGLQPLRETNHVWVYRKEL